MRTLGVIQDGVLYVEHVEPCTCKRRDCSLTWELSEQLRRIPEGTLLFVVYDTFTVKKFTGHILIEAAQTDDVEDKLNV